MVLSPHVFLRHPAGPRDDLRRVPGPGPAVPRENPRGHRRVGQPDAPFGYDRLRCGPDQPRWPGRRDPRCRLRRRGSGRSVGRGRRPDRTGGGPRSGLPRIPPEGGLVAQPRTDRDGGVDAADAGRPRGHGPADAVDRPGPGGAPRAAAAGPVPARSGPAPGWAARRHSRRDGLGRPTFLPAGLGGGAPPDVDHEHPGRIGHRRGLPAEPRGHRRPGGL